MTRIITAVPTAFHNDGRLDLAGNARVFQHALQGGVDALFVNGTTAEFPALTREERAELIRTAVHEAGPDRVIAHVGGASTYEAVGVARDALQAGAHTLAALTPFYLPASAAALRDYFSAVREESGDAHLFLYLFPDRTGVHVDAQEAALLVRELGFVGVKVSMPGLGFVKELLPLLPEGVEVYSGNDGLLATVARLGGAGVVSGVSSALPTPFVKLAEAVASGDRDAEKTTQELVDAAVAVLGPSIAALKLGLVEQGVIESAAVRMAIEAPDPQLTSRVHDVIHSVMTAESVS